MTSRSGSGYGRGLSRTGVYNREEGRIGGNAEPEKRENGEGEPRPARQRAHGKHPGLHPRLDAGFARRLAT